MFKSILALESPWDSTKVDSKSVWPFVSEFARATGLRAFHQSFSDKASFQHWVRRFNKDKDVPQGKLLYVAAHGSEGRVSGLRRSINGSTIAKAIAGAKSIRYAHFGSCFFGTEQNLTTLLQTAKQLHWVAGYDKQVEWIDSTLFDIMLWGRIAFRDRDTKGQKSHTVVKSLISQMPQFATELGFRLQYRYGKTIHSAIADDLSGNLA